MDIIIFSHPSFLVSKSMPKYTKWLCDGMRNRGHSVEIWSPKPRAYNASFPYKYKKWLGYLDQYIIFPFEVRNKLRKCHEQTLYVFSDQALGPWVSMVKEKPTVIHCHDFLALMSSLGEVKENPVSLTGKIYQDYIRKGFSNGKNFIAISKKTASDLKKYLFSNPKRIKVIYNGLNYSFDQTISIAKARIEIGKRINLNVDNGYILHVGGNQWYKNRVGLIEIYNAWRVKFQIPIPLLMIGAPPSAALQQAKEVSPFSQDIHFVLGIDDAFLSVAYCGAAVFLFPSLAEGFGWPIAEAMASGCPVITTGEAPMNEVGGDAAVYISRRPADGSQSDLWADEVARILQKLLNLSPDDRQALVEKCRSNAKRFSSDSALDKIEVFYKEILEDYK